MVNILQLKNKIIAEKTMKLLILINVFCFLQSRTPALVFEHVNNTDFKVGTI